MTNEPERDPRARAAELQLDACLHELAGVLPSPNLGDRIVAAAATALPFVGERANVSRHTRWLVAATIVLGAGVVGGVAWLRDRAQDQPAVAPVEPQDPPKAQDPKQTPTPTQPAKVTTFLADYSDNQIIELDDRGNVVWVAEDVFGAWDVELLDNDNLLVTEFSVSRVQEVDRKGNQVWVFEDLKNPYDADRLPNGNTLIADTFGSRVIEVDPRGTIVWQYGDEKTPVRPFDCDRLPNGSTLIADVLKDRIVEVNGNGEIVWEVRDMPHAHDADRLANGNTLVALRNKGQVVEVDRHGKVVWRLEGLSAPADADRLPNGNTLVAENTRVSEWDATGKLVWQRKTTWSVEVNRYAR